MTTKLIIIMGLPGAGKTTLAERLAKDMGWLFYDMDDTMPERFRDKMRNKELITDEDRDDYYDKTIKEFQEKIKSNSIVTAQVIMRERHRQLIKDSIPNTHYFRLDAPFEVLAERIGERKGHFYKADILKKSMESEDPLEIEHVKIDATKSLEEVYAELKKQVLSLP